MREVREEAEDDQHVRPDEDALEHVRRGPVTEDVGDRVRDGRPLRRPRVQAERDERRVPQEERRHDSGDQCQDEVGLSQVAPLEAARALHLADEERGRDAGEHQYDEEIDEKRVPALALEPAERRSRGERLLPVDDRDDRHEDRREEHQEPPEDECMHEPWDESLQKLALPEDDRRFVPHAGRDVRGATDRLAGANDPCEEERASSEEPACDRGRDDERDDRCCCRHGASAGPRIMLSPS